MPRLSKIGAAALAAFGWTGLSSVSASYLVVAGGGGGGGIYGAGGGGAGGYRTGTASLNPTLSYAIIVGAGGGGSAGRVNGSAGADSSFNSITSAGGGYGAGDSTDIAGGAGGSGGGGSKNSSAAGGAGNTPSTSPSQGNNGGAASSAGSQYGGGGGGGASATGSVGTIGGGGAGGAGSASSISGSSVTYAGGGGGSGEGSSGGAGGAGGGGAGTANSARGGNGTANLGGGGGGGGGTSGASGGGSGGSGVVIISYPAPQKFGGGVVTTSGSNVIHTFNTSGTLSPLSSLTASYLIVAGGGGGGGRRGAGGGAGGLLSGSSLTIDTNSNYLVTVGAGGAGGVGTPLTVNLGSSGTNSAFSMVTTSAVGGGGGSGDGEGAGLTGGSGGGGSSGSGGSATSGQGNAGGSGPNSAPNYGGGGGGGASAVGTDGTSTTGGNGGAGTASSISGTSTTYAGGGGGGTYLGGTAGSGGAGGGGGGGTGGTDNNGTAGTANLGGGGGGGSIQADSSNRAGGNGGSGVVIISYAGSTQQMAGGTVTIAGGNVIHTFTSSGYLTPIKYVNNSLRFRKSASAYLNRNPASNGTRTTWTYSTWVKRGQLGAGSIIHAQDSGNTVSTEFNFVSDDTIYFREYGGSGYTGYLQTTQVFRDPSAWYHLVLVWDSNNGTSGDRIRLYVNGTRITSFSTATYPSSGITTVWNSTNLNRIGFPSTSTMDGYLTEVNFIDGQALTPNSFGTFNSYGVWQPITYGGSYGTNGFYLPFTNKTSTTTLGYDFSPNGNNWTTNNISLTAGSTYDSMTDVPTLTSATAANYCVVNPLDKGTGLNITNGNLQHTADSSGNWYQARCTFAFPATGKFYWELTFNAGTNSWCSCSIAPSTTSLTMGWGPSTYANVYGMTLNGTLYTNNSTTSYGSSFVSGDVFMVAFDRDNSKIYFGKNGTWFNSSDPVTQTNPAASGITTSVNLFPLVGGVNSSGGASNWGQQPFVYTPPTGFVALNTYNL